MYAYIYMQPQEAYRKDIIGNYQLGKTLGEGTFGKVKAAVHIPTNQPVAIKILDKSRIIDTADVERVSREIHILKLVRHPNIIQLYELIETPKYLLLVMEYATNGELFDHIVDNKKLTEREACQIFQQILNGVEYVHRLNIVHRDLKPENLLIDFDQSIKVVDFGLSNTYKKNELLATACGSPCYASPEMIKGKKYSGLTTDIWSAGVILFAMVCGYLPFEDPQTSVLYDKIKAGKYKLPKDVSSQFKDLLAGVLDVNPDTRMRVDDIKKHEWWQQCKSTRNSTGILVGYDRIPIDLQVLAKLQALGYDTDHAQKSIEANRHNSVTTSYYLLLKKNRKNGANSRADIASNNFDPKLLVPLKKKDRVKTMNYDEDDIEGATAKKSRLERPRSKHYSSMSKHVPPAQLNLGRSSTNETDYNGSISKKSQIENLNVEVSIPSKSRRYHIPSMKVRRASASKDSNNSYSRTQTHEDQPSHYANLIERHYNKLYRRPLMSKSRERDFLRRSQSKQKRLDSHGGSIHGTSIHLNRSFMDQSCRVNNPMMKMRDSINRQRDRKRPQPLRTSIPTSKSTEKAYSFLRQ